MWHHIAWGAFYGFVGVAAVLICLLVWESFFGDR